jgi:hypothetical protein
VICKVPWIPAYRPVPLRTGAAAVSVREAEHVAASSVGFALLTFAEMAVRSILIVPFCSVAVPIFLLPLLLVGELDP